MNAEQKQRAVDLIDVTKTYRLDAEECAMQMAALLQELVDAPEPEPVARVTGYYAGYLSIATVDGRVLPAGTALYLAPPAPPAPSVPDGWRQFLTDVITAAGLLKYGKRDKGLAGRIGKFAFDAMRAATTPAEPPADVARDAALYCAVLRSCAELPEGWEIRIELERSAGTVSLVNPDGEDVDYPSDHEYMASDINDAIDSAIAAEKGGAK